MSTVRSRRSHADGRLASSGAAGIAGRASLGRRTPRLQVSEIQRARLLNAAVRAIDEVGYADVSVTDITGRARVSRRTFYDLFDNREDCLATVLEDTLARIHVELTAAGVGGLPWRERMRAGLHAVLAFLDREPTLARACVVQGARGSERLLERRAAIFAALARAIDEGRHERAGGVPPPPLTAEGLVGAAHAIVYERLLRRSPEPLTGLLPQLMGMIVLPYLGSASARREYERPAPAPSTDEPLRTPGDRKGDPLRNIPMRLTYRTIRVLQTIAADPGASNRTIGDAAGISDQGQASKLLSRLERLGLIDNEGGSHTRGERNAWRLTPLGESVASDIRVHDHDRRRAA